MPTSLTTTLRTCAVAAAGFLVAASALVVAGCARPPAAQPQQLRPSPEPIASEPEDAALMYETVLYVVQDTTAYYAPSLEAEPSMRVAADERYRIAEQREGWYRLETEWKEVPAWLPAAAVRTAEELAPPSVINRRLSE